MSFLNKLQNGVNAFGSSATKTWLNRIESKHPNLSSSDERFIREVRQAISRGADAKELQMYLPQIKVLMDQCKK